MRQPADQVSLKLVKLDGVDRNVPFFDPLAFALLRKVDMAIPSDMLRGPGVINTDLFLYRSFPIRESLQLQFRAKVFNAANTPHFNNPGANVSNRKLTPTGMSITSARTDERVFRFALRLQF